MDVVGMAKQDAARIVEEWIGMGGAKARKRRLSVEDLDRLRRLIAEAVEQAWLEGFDRGYLGD